MVGRILCQMLATILRFLATEQLADLRIGAHTESTDQKQVTGTLSRPVHTGDRKHVVGVQSSYSSHAPRFGITVQEYRVFSYLYRVRFRNRYPENATSWLTITRSAPLITKVARVSH